MSGRRSRTRGAGGERELANKLSEAGFEATRNARNGISSEDIQHNIPGVHIECKRQERIAFDAWIRQAESDAEGKVPVVAFRKNQQPWRVIIPLEYWLELEGKRRECKDS